MLLAFTFFSRYCTDRVRSGARFLGFFDAIPRVSQIERSTRGVLYFHTEGCGVWCGLLGVSCFEALTGLTGSPLVIVSERDSWETHIGTKLIDFANINFGS